MRWTITTHPIYTTSEKGKEGGGERRREGGEGREEGGEGREHN